MEIYINKSMVERAARVREQQERAKSADAGLVWLRGYVWCLVFLAAVFAATMLYALITNNVE